MEKLKNLKGYLLSSLLGIILFFIAKIFDENIKSDDLIGWAIGFPAIYYAYKRFISKKLKRKEQVENVQKAIDVYKKKIKIVDISQIDNIISKHEKVIMNYDKNKHHDLIRLSKFIKNLETKINEQFNWGTSSDNIYSSELLSYINLEKNTKNLDLLVKLNITMINKLVEDKITDFLIIYEKFEEVGAFRTSFENELLNKLDKLTDKLENISTQLRKIDSKLGYQNLVLTYNSYQFNQIRKSLKK